MWYYKVVVGILLLPWSLILLMAVGAARHRYARKARVIVLSPTPLETAAAMPIGLPEPAPAYSTDLDVSAPQIS